MIKAIVIDDEKRARQLLTSLLEDFMQDIDVVGQADSAISGKEAIEKENPDLVFLDIEMPKGNGFTLFDHFEEPDFEVIFTTAHDLYAINAIKYAALDYLLKPINIQELKKAIAKQLSSLRVSEELVDSTLKKLNPSDNIASWDKDTMLQLAVEFRKATKPMIIACNKIDVPGAKEKFESLKKEFPDHGFLGEEFGSSNSDKEYIWIIDPIDGTKNYIRNVPLFATQIGLLHKGKFIAGVSNMPGYLYDGDIAVC